MFDRVKVDVIDVTREIAVIANGVTAPQNGVKLFWVDSRIGVPN